MYMHVVHEVSFPKIEMMFGDLFGFKIDHPRIYHFKLMMASYYSPTIKENSYGISSQETSSMRMRPR